MSGQEIALSSQHLQIPSVLLESPTFCDENDVENILT